MYTVALLCLLDAPSNSHRTRASVVLLKFYCNTVLLSAILLLLSLFICAFFTLVVYSTVLHNVQLSLLSELKEIFYQLRLTIPVLPCFPFSQFILPHHSKFRKHNTVQAYLVEICGL